MMLTLPTYVADWWKPIETAPFATPVLVSDRTSWTLAKRVSVQTLTLRFGWPIVKSESSLAWLYANSMTRRIDFVPTHWMPPPPGPR